MDKKIKLEMKDNKDIVIKVNDEEKITIKKDNRKIQANDIFKLLNYSIGDTYVIEVLNEKRYDLPVIQFFYELLCEIIKKLPREDENTKENIGN